MSESVRPPRVVLFRPMPLDRDTRAKKFAATLARGGYDVTILSPVVTGADTSPGTMGPVTVVPVPVSTRHRDAANRQALVRRQRRYRVLTTESPESYVTRVRELKYGVRASSAKAARLRSAAGANPAGVVAAAKWSVVRAEAAMRKVALKATRARWGGQDRLDKAVTKAWRAADQRRMKTTALATTEGVLPEILDYADAFAPVLDRLQPDVIHAHHPFILHTAVRAARRRRADGHECAVVYDARENFAGIPEGEQGSVRRHSVLVRQEADTIRDMNRVITVSEPIADELLRRYGLGQRPGVVLNVPVAAGVTSQPTIREAIGLGPDETLLVYSGGISAARGLETLIDAMGDLADLHLALVPVPFPHPSVKALLERAAEVGAADRIHVTAPVTQEHIATFLSGADIAIHPMPGGSPNHDQAMPNKLFEYLHAGLPLVVSDAKLMAAFVNEHNVGRSFTSGDAAALTAAVRDLVASPPTPQHVADVAGRYSWQGQEHLILDLYDDVTGWTSTRPSDPEIPLDVVMPQLGDPA